MGSSFQTIVSFERSDGGVVYINVAHIAAVTTNDSGETLVFIAGDGKPFHLKEQADEVIWRIDKATS